MSWKSLLEMGEAGELHPFIDYGTDNDIQEVLKPEDFAPEDVGMEKAHNLQLHVQECENTFFKNMLHNMSHKWAAKNSNKQFKKEPFLPLYKAALLTVKLDPEGYSTDAVCEFLRSRKECPQKAYRLLQNICSAINTQSLKAYKNSKLFDGAASLSEKTHILELELEREEFIHWLERSYIKSSGRTELPRMKGRERKLSEKPPKAQLTEYEEICYHNLIAALSQLLISGTHIKMSPINKSKIIEKITTKYPAIKGLSKNTLDAKIKRAQDLYRTDTVFPPEAEGQMLFIINTFIDFLLSKRPIHSENILVSQLHENSQSLNIECTKQLFSDANYTFKWCLKEKVDEGNNAKSILPQKGKS